MAGAYRPVSKIRFGEISAEAGGISKEAVSGFTAKKSAEELIKDRERPKLDTIQEEFLKADRQWEQAKEVLEQKRPGIPDK